MKGELSRAAKKNTRKAPSTKTAGSSGFHVSTMGNRHSHRRATNPPRTIAGTGSTAGTNHHASPALSRSSSFCQTVRVTSSDGDRKKTQVTLTNTKIQDPGSLEPGAQRGPACGSHLPFPAEDALDRQIGSVESSPQHEVPARAVPEPAQEHGEQQGRATEAGQGRRAPRASARRRPTTRWPMAFRWPVPGREFANPHGRIRPSASD